MMGLPSITCARCERPVWKVEWWDNVADVPPSRTIVVHCHGARETHTWGFPEFLLVGNPCVDQEGRVVALRAFTSPSQPVLPGRDTP